MQEKEENKILELIYNDQSFDQGFKQLVLKYQEPLYWHIRRMVHFHEDADDVIQNTFIKVFKNIKGFKGQSKLYTWLYRIASNEALTFLKKKKKQQSLDIESHISELETKLIADEFFDADKAQISLIKAIELLPEKQKQIFNMRYYDNLKYKDISEIVGTSVGALKASYHHAVTKIETYLKESLNHV